MKKVILSIVLLFMVFTLSACSSKKYVEKQDEFSTSTVKIIENKASNDCGAACDKYVKNCLTLVPNANEAFFTEGHESCLKECKNWDSEKVDCMINAIDCPSMTEVCGL
ncbi:MAG: hypothetical protein PHZ07_02955 [Patescibacteria group bacterium]|nr:hypothetical protein [Patescibacteria group bacterium]MDD4304296.1 hypothetical protein [Patescibacteria group bacterium]MDD4695677.1 hypothetical protein [Patescibacteria group bacterium]